MTHMYLFERKNCVNCPAADEVVKELEAEINDLNVTRVDIDEIDEELEYELGLQQIFVFSVPTIVIFSEQEKKFKTISTGEIPDIGMLRFEIGAN